MVEDAAMEMEIDDQKNQFKKDRKQYENHIAPEQDDDIMDMLDDEGLADLLDDE